MNISSSIPDSHAPVVGKGRLDVSRTLSPVARAIGLGRVARGALLGFALGAAIGAGILFAGHLHALGFALPAAFVAAAFGLLAGAAAGGVRWPHTFEAARTADRYFQLDDRLTTALELHDTDTPVALLQNRDVAQRIDGLSLAQQSRSLAPAA